MKQTERVAYDRTIRTIQQAMPWFADFVIEPLELNKNNVQLDWHERGSDLLFGPHQLPDGALRAMALFTLLLQPKEWLPRIIVIDEPELGLHPSAINILAGLAEAAARHCQIVLATQSVTLVDQLDPDEVIAVDREDGASTFKRVPDQMSPELLKEWLDDYSLSELWEKNVIGGGPF
jgi:predicted ATPase